MPSTEEQKPVRRKEALLFAFLIICFFPLLSVAIVGGYGFFVWFLQMLFGPPGPPG